MNFVLKYSISALQNMQPTDMQEEQLQFISPLAYITYCPEFIICNK